MKDHASSLQKTNINLNGYFTLEYENYDMNKYLFLKYILLVTTIFKHTLSLSLLLITINNQSNKSDKVSAAKEMSH